MANRIPLIVDTLDDNKIKELPVGDNLDLGGAGVTNVGSINATDVTINGVSFNNPFSGDYNDLTNKPIIPTVPTALSAFANDTGFLAAGTTTDQVNEGLSNLYFSTARVDARIQSTSLSSLSNVDNVSATDDGKVLYYDHASGNFKLTNVVTEADTLNSILSRGNATELDINSTGKVYFSNVFAEEADLPDATTYHGMFAHVHATGKGYFAHSGSWVPLQNESSAFTGWSTAGDDGQAKTVSSNETISFLGGTGITTTTDGQGNVTITVGALDDLTDVDAASPNNGQALIWSNLNQRWQPGTVSSSIAELGDLDDVNVITVAPQDNYVLSWNGGNSEWRPRPLNNLDAATVSTQFDATATSQFITFVSQGSAGGQTLHTDAGITYNPSTNTLATQILTATSLTTTNIAINGNVTGTSDEVAFNDNIKLASAGELRYYAGDNQNYSAFRAPATLSGNTTFILPNGDGTNGQVLVTDGSGTLSWTSVSSSTNTFVNFAVSGQNTVSADAVSDTLTLIAGNGITLTTDNVADSITITSTGGGGSTPGGVSGTVQYNDGGSLAGDGDFTFDANTNTLAVTNINATQISADEIVSSSTGIPTLTSASNLILDAANAVVIQRAPLRLGIFDTDGVNLLVGQKGDIIYNSSVGEIQWYNGSGFEGVTQPYSFNIGADDSTMRTVSNNENIKIIGGNNVSTTSDAEGNITVNAAIAGGVVVTGPSEGDMTYYNGTNWVAVGGPVYHYTVTNSGTSAYRLEGPGVSNTTDNPNLTLYRGATYIFKNTTGSAHPFAIRTEDGGSTFSEGVSGSQTGTQIFEVPHEPSDTALVYQCTLHSAMLGNLTIV